MHTAKYELPDIFTEANNKTQQYAWLLAQATAPLQKPAQGATIVLVTNLRMSTNIFDYVTGLQHVPAVVHNGKVSPFAYFWCLLRLWLMAQHACPKVKKAT